jgi:3-deoxy-D-manno-octulosonic-acid transferase
MNPAALMFIRNDIWPNLKHEAVKKNIPVFFLGAPVRSINSVIKKSFYRFIYSEFKSIFTITDEAYEFHRGLNPHTTVIYAGDTKYDIVISRKNERKIKIPKPGSPCILLGSVWPDDLRVIVPALLNSLQTNPLCTFIIAPHEITTASINYLLFKFERYNPVLYSEFKQKPRKFQVLIVDTIGDLFFLYENSSIAYVGGGFGTGIHNILEPAAMGNVVIFGPKHEKFPEAKYLIDSGCAFCVKSREEFENIFYDLMDHVQKVKKLAGQSQSAVMKQTGASQVVFTHLVKTLSLKGISKN